MRNSFVLAALFVVAAGCAPYPSGFRIDKFYPVDDCTNEAREESISPNGFLDVAPGSPQFFIGVQIGGAESISQPATVVGGRTIELADRDRPLLKLQTMTYRFSKAGLSAKPYVVNFSAPFDDNGEVYGPIQLLSPDVGLLLEDNAGPIEDAFDLFVDVEFTGIMSGSGTAITTGKATFPIKVFDSGGPVCPSGPLKTACSHRGQSTYQVFQPAYTCDPPTP